MDRKNRLPLLSRLNCAQGIKRGEDAISSSLGLVYSIYGVPHPFFHNLNFSGSYISVTCVFSSDESGKLFGRPID
jgi:hypothetical protein